MPYATQVRRTGAFTPKPKDQHQPVLLNCRVTYAFAYRVRNESTMDTSKTLRRALDLYLTQLAVEKIGGKIVAFGPDGSETTLRITPTIEEHYTT